MASTRNQHTSNYSPNLKVMDDLYAFHDEIGSGGFGKVKLATHLLTGEKVAIKIIDKNTVGEDLPRILRELDALKELAHQNICRLYQYVDTDEKFYIVMEYCNGGEMFDYIVRKSRLEEPEARHFFRQLVQAVAYVHSRGYAHRDLKPENLLLKEDLQLKVIDFGLSAKPLDGLKHQLQTCCGSPAYAAPELLKNAQYYGNEVDIWSMGVMLYALLCGALPFEDTHWGRLYKKIQVGNYYEPIYLGVQSRLFIRAMLTVEPSERITIKEVMEHPWLTKDYHQPLKYNTIYDKNVIDEDIACELAFFYSLPLNDIVDYLKEWHFDYITATYLILLQKKEKKQKIVLPYLCVNDTHNAISPLIHASLEKNINQQGVGHWKYATLDVRRSRKDPADKTYMNMPDVNSWQFTSDTLKRIFCLTNPRPIIVQSVMKSWKLESEKCRSAVKKVEELTPKRKTPGGQLLRYTANRERPAGSGRVADMNSVFGTPRRVPKLGTFYTLQRRPKSAERAAIEIPPVAAPRPPGSSQPPPTNRQQPAAEATTDLADESSSLTTNAHSSVVTELSEPTTTDSGGRTPRSELKSPSRLRQRVFKSLERKADKMIHLLTPRKMRQDNEPVKVKSSNIVNLSVTSSKDPYHVREELIRILTNLGITPIQNGWKVSGSKKDKNGQMTVQYEVVLIDNMDYLVAVKRRRISGDALKYVRVCEEVLKLCNENIK